MHRIGGACARVLFLQHVHLALTYHSNRDSVDKLAKQLVEEYSALHPSKTPPRTTVHRADLSNVDETLKLAEEAKASHSQAVDILIANAGYGVRITDIEYAATSARMTRRYPCTGLIRVLGKSPSTFLSTLSMSTCELRSSSRRAWWGI